MVLEVRKTENNYISNQYRNKVEFLHFSLTIHCIILHALTQPNQGHFNTKLKDLGTQVQECATVRPIIVFLRYNLLKMLRSSCQNKSYCCNYALFVQFLECFPILALSLWLFISWFTFWQIFFAINKFFLGKLTLA